MADMTREQVKKLEERVKFLEDGLDEIANLIHSTDRKTFDYHIVDDIEEKITHLQFD